MARYIQPPQQQYVSQYVPKDLNFYQQQIDKSQTRYDTTQAMYSEALGTLGEMEAYDQDTKNELIQGLTEDFENTYSKYQGDLSKATGDVMGIVSKTRANPLLGLLKEQTRQGRALEQALLANPSLFVLRDPRNVSVKDVGSAEQLAPIIANLDDIPAMLQKSFSGYGDRKLQTRTPSEYYDDVITKLGIDYTTEGVALEQKAFEELISTQPQYAEYMESNPEFAQAVANKVTSYIKSLDKGMLENREYLSEGALKARQGGGSSTVPTRPVVADNTDLGAINVFKTNEISSENLAITSDNPIIEQAKKEVVGAVLNEENISTNGYKLDEIASSIESISSIPEKVFTPRYQAPYLEKLTKGIPKISDIIIRDVEGNLDPLATYKAIEKVTNNSEDIKLKLTEINHKLIKNYRTDDNFTNYLQEVQNALTGLESLAIIKKDIQKNIDTYIQDSKGDLNIKFKYFNLGAAQQMGDDVYKLTKKSQEIFEEEINNLNFSKFEFLQTPSNATGLRGTEKERHDVLFNMKENGNNLTPKGVGYTKESGVVFRMKDANQGEYVVKLPPAETNLLLSSYNQPIANLYEKAYQKYDIYNSIISKIIETNPKATWENFAETLEKEFYNDYINMGYDTKAAEVIAEKEAEKELTTAFIYAPKNTKPGSKLTLLTGKIK